MPAQKRVSKLISIRAERAESRANALESHSAEAQRTATPYPLYEGRAEHAAPMLPSERTAHGRAGESALASRLSRLESMLCRLVSSPLHNLVKRKRRPQTGSFSTVGFRPNHVVLRGGLPDSSRGHRESGARFARRQSAARKWPRYPDERTESETSRTSRNQRSQSLPVSQGTLRDSLDSTRR